ncbi:MAG: hypothetical protein AAGC79_08750 [Pseudomonadota bacterium]
MIEYDWLIKIALAAPLVACWYGRSRYTNRKQNAAWDGRIFIIKADSVMIIGLIDAQLCFIFAQILFFDVSSHSTGQFATDLQSAATQFVSYLSAEKLVVFLAMLVGVFLGAISLPFIFKNFPVPEKRHYPTEISWTETTFQTHSFFGAVREYDWSEVAKVEWGGQWPSGAKLRIADCTCVMLDQFRARELFLEVAEQKVTRSDERVTIQIGRGLAQA